MYKVYFENSLFANVKSIEEATSLGLAVHRSSNIPHVVVLRNPDDTEILTYTLKDTK